MRPHAITPAQMRRLLWLPFVLAGLVLGSEYLQRSVAAQAPSTSIWTDRPLATVPRGYTPRVNQWDNWITITDDLQHLAYLVRYRRGSDMRETFVFDGRRGPEFVWASRGVLSPDGRHLAYIGILEEDGALPAYLVVGDVRIQMQFKDRHLGPDWYPVFSPDGRKLAFRAERPNGWYAIGILHVEAATQEAAAAERHVVWGPDFLDMDRPAWAPDSSVVGYAGARSNSEWAVMVGADVHALWRDASGVTFSPSGEVVYKATDGVVQFVVAGGQRQASFTTVTAPTIRADGTLAYGATEGRRSYVITGTQKTAVPHAVEGAAVSADGARLMWWYRDDNRERMHINGERGRKFTRVSSPVLHPDAGTFVYTAEDNGRFYVITPLGVHDYDGVLWLPRISPDGTKAGFVALVGNQLT
jgi:hypothetical protein